MCSIGYGSEREVARHRRLYCILIREPEWKLSSGLYSSSCRVFLYGSGVSGYAFPQLLCCTVFLFPLPLESIPELCVTSSGQENLKLKGETAGRPSAYNNFCFTLLAETQPPALWPSAGVRDSCRGRSRAGGEAKERGKKGERREE